MEPSSCKKLQTFLALILPRWAEFKVSDTSGRWAIYVPSWPKFTRTKQIIDALHPYYVCIRGFQDYRIPDNFVCMLNQVYLVKSPNEVQDSTTLFEFHPVTFCPYTYEIVPVRSEDSD